MRAAAVVVVAALAGLGGVGIGVGSVRDTSSTPSDATEGADRDEIRPVYGEASAKDPLATRLCAALHAEPNRRRAECEGRALPGFSAAPLCEQALSAAITSGAVEVAANRVASCEIAMREAVRDCGFTGTVGLPHVAACEGLLRGRREIGERCRSSLECPERAQCLGAGPVDEGVCAPPSPDGALCGTAVDVLAAYTRQRSAERDHPSCEGRCARHRCTALITAGDTTASGPR